ncbi:zeta toxin family protein [Nonomuraea sp. NPDC048901]|uniref:zeta toxin family protein n=1 Tax=Nonomuraea sp. NPDC048901 TaxID=3155627 RepID=UPI00340D021B
MTRNVSTPVTSPLAGQDDTIGSGGYATDITPAWGTSLPAWCDALIALLSSGQMWPEASESGEAALAVAFEDWSQAALEFAAAGGTARDLIMQGYFGSAAEEFKRQADQLLAEGKGIPALAALAHAYALQHDSYARETQYAKLLINAGFWITVSSIAISAFATAASAGVLTPLIGKFAGRLRTFMDKVFTWLERVAKGRYAGSAAIKQAPKLAALGGRQAGKGLLARAAASHMLREIPEEIGEGFLMDYVAQKEQMDRGTRTQWDGQKTASTILGDASGAVLASKVAGPVAGLVGRLPGIRSLNAAAGDAPGALNAVMRFPGRALQTGLTNAVISTPAGLVSNGIVYGKWDMPTAESLLGGVVAGVGRTNTISPFSVDVMSAIIHPRQALDTATTAALAGDTARAAATAAPPAPASPVSAPPDTPAGLGGPVEARGFPAQDVAATRERAEVPRGVPDTKVPTSRPEPAGSTRTSHRPEPAQQAPEHREPGQQPRQEPQQQADPTDPTDPTDPAGQADTTEHVDTREHAEPSPPADPLAPAEIADPTVSPQARPAEAPSVPPDHTPVHDDPSFDHVRDNLSSTQTDAVHRAEPTATAQADIPGGTPSDGPRTAEDIPTRRPQASTADPVTGGRSFFDLLSGKDAVPPQMYGPAQDRSQGRPYQYETSGPDQWKLTEEDNDLIFRRDIVPDLMAGVRRPEHPRIVFIGGQAASGKTTAQQSAMDGMGPDRALIADFEGLLKYHPRYAHLMAENDRIAAKQAGGDAYAWMKKVIALAAELRVNLIREGAMNSSEGVEAEAAQFHALGYRAEAHVMAVPAPISRLSVLNRYQQMRDRDGHGRLVSQDIHDQGYGGIPDTMRAIDRARYLEAITLHQWGGEIVYRNSLDDTGHWRGPARAEEILREARERPFTQEETDWFRRTYADLDGRLPEELRAQLPEIADMAAAHGVDLDPEGRAERLRERYTAQADGVLRDEQVEQRERLWQEHQRRLAEAAPAERERLSRELAEEWDRLAEQHELGRAGLRVLAYCTEWDPHKGGIIAVNRKLVEGLAEAGHEVYVRVGHEVPSGTGGERLHVIGPRQYDPGRSEMDQLAFDGEELPPDVDVVIGHSRYSGPAALRARDQLYPDAPLVHVLHMVTGALGRIADMEALGRDFEGIERALVAEADMLAGVGPVLATEAQRLADSNPGDRVPPVHELLPGVPFELSRQRPFFGERTRTVLLIGRADAAQKGGHEAALMIRELQKDLDVRLVIRGAASETVPEVKERLSNVAGREVEIKPFTLDREEILADMRNADVVIMPSRGEGFGLVGLEAAGAAVPILVPRSSGVGALLGDPGRFPPELTRASLVEQGFEDRVPVERWATHLKEILGDLPRAQEKARQLQQLLREANATWKGAGESLVAAVQDLATRQGLAAGHAAAPELPPMPGEGWVNCAQGHAHWGLFGGAGLLVHHRAPGGETHVLMQQRDPSVDQGGTWSLPGGARDSHESAAEAALRETVEESDLPPGEVHVEEVVRDDHGGWSYDTVIASVAERMPVAVKGSESGAMAWIPISRVTELDLHPGFAASWPRVRAVLEGESPVPAESEPVYPAAARYGFADAPALTLPAHPVTGARVTRREPLAHGDGLLNRELVTFDDGTQATYERYARAGDATVKVLDSHVGRAVGARVPLSYALGSRDVYSDHMPGEQATDQSWQRAATRDGVFLGLYHAVTAKHGVTLQDLALGRGGALLGVGDGAASHLLLPDAANPFVRTFFRETEPRVFRWVDNPIPPNDIAIIKRQLDGLRPLFERMNRLHLHEAILQRLWHVAEHARGTGPLLPRAADHAVTLPVTEPVGHYAPPPPPGSPERTHHRQVAEALLTGDGAFTDTSPAKTHTINALAGSMRSSTPELVLAAVGLHVGSDMVNRLGDGDYVLAPFNERYPSMGARVLHVDALDPADPAHAPDRVVRMDDPFAEILVRRIAVSELLGAWAHRNANSNVRVLALQEVVQEEFGLTEAMSWPMDGKTRSAVDMELLYNRKTLREFIRRQYELTQAELARRGIEEVIAYRGMAWPEGEHSAWAGLRPGDMFEMRHRPLASWSADRQVVMDWLDSLPGRGVLLIDRKPARDIISVPLTGMGFFGQREFVSLPGDRLATLDHISAGIGGSFGEAEPPMAVGDHGGWTLRPTPVTTGELDLTDPLSHRIDRVLKGQEPYPSWWPHDDSGYHVTKRDLDFLGMSPMQLKWLVTRQAPMGMTPERYHRYAGELLDAIGRDGIGPAEVDIRLKGTGAEFFAGLHKTFPAEDELAGNPEALRRLREWFGDDPNRPLRRPFDSMYRLGLEQPPSDYDMDISSSAMVQVARSHWPPGRYPGDFMGGHGYIDKDSLMRAFPELAAWKNDWETALGRPISLGLFESSGPFDGTSMGSELSSHFRDTDWIIHRPANPRAWLTTWPSPDTGGPLADVPPGRPSTDGPSTNRPFVDGPFTDGPSTRREGE